MSEQDKKPVEEEPEWKVAMRKEWKRRHGDSNSTSTMKKNKNSADLDHVVWPLAAKPFGDDVILEAIDSILTGQLTMSKKVFEFEDKFAKAVGSKYAVMVNSGSSANLVAVAAAVNPKHHNRVPLGSECLVPAVCWSTSLWPVIQLGLKPVLVDSDPTTLNICCRDLQRKITSKTKAIVLVHVLGNCAPMDEIMYIVKKHNLVLIEDTCESLGSLHKGQFLGTFGDFGTYSFYFSHHITTGEGGMVVTNSLEQYDLLKCLRAHGWSRSLSKDAKDEVEAAHPQIDRRFLFVNMGFNLRPMEMSGAIGILQLEMLQKANFHRRDNHKRIEKAVKLHPKNVGQFDHIIPADDVDPAWFGWYAVITKLYAHQHRAFLKFLTSRGVENRPIISGNFAVQPGLKLMGMDVRPEDFPGAEIIGNRGFFVGVQAYKVGDEDINRFVDILMEFPWSQQNTILVTGGTGLVGRALQEFSATCEKDRWVFLGSKDADLADLAECRAVFAKHAPTHVIHAAAWLMDGANMANHKVEIWEANQHMNENVLKVCRELKVKKLLSIMSSFAYPAVIPDNAPESAIHSGLPHPPLEGYSYSKRMMDIMTRWYREQFNCPFVTVLPTNIFGPFGRMCPGGPVVEGVISRTLKAHSEKSPLTLFGSGKPVRQFVYNKDLAKILYWALFNYSETETMNITGDEITIGEVCDAVVEAVGFEGEIVTDTSRPDGVMKRTLSGDKFAKLWPEFKPTPFKDALKTTVDHYIARNLDQANPKQYMQ